MYGICPCQGDDKCKHELTQNLEEDTEEAEEVFIEDVISSRELFQGVICECSGENVWNYMHVPVKWAYMHSCMPLRRQGRLHNGLTHIRQYNERYVFEC